MLQVFENVMFLFHCQTLCITVYCMSYSHLSLFLLQHEFVFLAVDLIIQNKPYLILSYLIQNHAITRTIVYGFFKLLFI